MNRRVASIVGSLVLVASVAAYFVAPSVFGGPFPERSNAERFFEKNEDGLNALYRRLSADGFARISCHTDVVRAGTEPKGHGQELRGNQSISYMSLCHDANASMGWRVDSGFLFYIGATGDDQMHFNIALIRLESRNLKVPRCEEMTPSEDFGKCHFVLAEDWVLDYEWMSESYADSFSEGAT